MICRRSENAMVFTHYDGTFIEVKIRSTLNRAIHHAR